MGKVTKACSFMFHLHYTEVRAFSMAQIHYWISTPCQELVYAAGWVSVSRTHYMQANTLPV